MTLDAGPSCLAALSALELVLKLKMSSLRMGGANGEHDPTSFFEKMHSIQLLSSSDISNLFALVAVHHFKRNDQEDPVVRKAMWLSVASAYLFAVRAYDFSVDADGYDKHGKAGNGKMSMFGTVGATGKYIAQAILIYKLIK